MNHYVIDEPPPLYERIDDNFYERLDEVKANSGPSTSRETCKENSLCEKNLLENPLYNHISKGKDLPNVVTDDRLSKKIMQNDVSHDAMDMQSYNDVLIVQLPKDSETASLLSIGSRNSDKSQS